MNASSLVDEAIAAHRVGDVATAERLYRAALALDSAHADALHLLALVYLHRSDADAALPYARDALLQAPSSPVFASTLCNCFMSLNRLDEAQEIALPFAQQTSPSADALNNLGAIALHREDFAAAGVWFAKAVQCMPHHVNARINFALLLLAEAQYAEAEIQLRAALDHAPDHPHAQAYLANLLFKRAEFPAAQALAEAASRTDPTLDEAWVVQAGCAWQREDFMQAIACYERALALAPARAALWADVAQCQKRLHRLTDALASSLLAIAGNAATPADEAALGLHISLKRELCDWSSFASDLRAVRNALATPRRLGAALEPLLLLSWPLSAAEHLQASRRYQAFNAELLSHAAEFTQHQRKSARLRVGFLTADMGDHPVMRLIVGVLEKLDAQRIESVGFATRYVDTALAQRVRAAFHCYQDCSALSDSALLEALRAAECDVLIDISGVSRASRSHVLQQRAADVQISWLGYPGSVGMPCMDYLLADDMLVPITRALHYSETIIRLPCFQVSDAQREAPIHSSRADCGLPEHAVVLCCFAQAHKLSPEMFSAWLDVLREVPHAVLWLAASHPQTEINLRAFAAARGVPSAQLVFAPQVSYARYLGHLALADLMLDTQPYSSGATANDALWMGCPIVTLLLPGADHYVSRMAASALTACGLLELVCSSWDEWHKCVLALVHNAPRRAALRAHLAQRERLPLHNTVEFTRNFEQLLRHSIDK